MTERAERTAELNNEPELVDAALEYVRHDIPIIPLWPRDGDVCSCPDREACKNPGKHPVGRFAPNGFKDATLDEAKVRLWWAAMECGIATPTGAASGWMLIDVDIRETGSGVIELAKLERTLGTLPTTKMVTTPSGGRHYYFKFAEGIPSNAKVLGQFLDVRAEGGMAILPPSHGLYKTVDRSVPIAELPPAWIEHLKGLRAASSSTYYPPEILEKLDELAALDPISYARARKDAKAELGISVALLDKEVEKRRIVRKLRKPKKPKESDEDALARLATSASYIIECENVLAMFDRQFRRVYEGERKNAKLLYLLCTTRLFSKPMSAALKGPSSAGKSQLVTSLLEFFPPEEIVKFTAMSERALLFMPEGLEHKILVMGEALDPKGNEFQDTLLRQLMSEGELRYPMVQKNADGVFETMMIEKKGPVCFLVTTTRVKLHPENETRVISLEVDDSEEQTAAVMLKVADVVGLGGGADKPDYKPWQDYQRWLAVGERRVVVPFARELASLIPPRSIRLRRDINQLLEAIKAHALIHRGNRWRDASGAIRATVTKDYRAVRALMVNTLSENVEVKLRKELAETLKAVADITADEDRATRGATTREIGKVLRLDRSAALRRLRTAEWQGLLTNLEPGKGRLAHYVLAERDDEELELLPTVADLREACREREEAEARDGVKHSPPRGAE